MIWRYIQNLYSSLNGICQNFRAIDVPLGQFFLKLFCQIPPLGHTVELLM